MPPGEKGDERRYKNRKQTEVRLTVYCTEMEKHVLVGVGVGWKGSSLLFWLEMIHYITLLFKMSDTIKMELRDSGKSSKMPFTTPMWLNH